ncbi:MAG: glycosyltransferase family 39 protein [Patescibacteria group bacterium]
MFNCADKAVKFSAILILITMFGFLFFSTQNDSATMDELAHIPAGYSYITEQDMRLNPEHPPLIKDLSAIPLLFLNLNFPTNITAWTTALNGQWDMGRIFLYESGNDADKMLRYSRLPMMLLAILFGWLFFKWTRGLYGNAVALLCLFLFALSPTFLAHSKYVTTDLAAAFGFFIGIAAFVNFINRKTTKSLIVCGVAFGIAQLLKFSLVILAPLYIILGILWIFLNSKKEFWVLGKIVLIGLIGLAIIVPFYVFHIWNYPVERQLADTTTLLSSFRVKFISNSVIWLADSSFIGFRAFGEYLLGILMVMGRAAGGNNVYFLGDMANTGWPTYFPLLYLLKEHLALHILTLIGLIFGIQNIVKSKEKNFRNFLEWLKENFALTASVIFIIIYWTQAVTSPLNIGVRHVLPTFPFIYLLVSRQTIRWIKGISTDSPQTFWGWVKSFYQTFIRPAKRGLVVVILLVWMGCSAIITYPHHLSYYNALGGGTDNGYKIAVDSNYDWGQDLKRLKDWTDKNIPANEPIAIDYFGGGRPQYYFGEQAKIWHSNMDSPEKQGIKWMAVSLNFLRESQATPVKGFVRKPEDTFSWLKSKKPYARAGTSIFIYKF